MNYFKTDFNGETVGSYRFYSDGDFKGYEMIEHFDEGGYSYLGTTYLTPNEAEIDFDANGNVLKVDGEISDIFRVDNHYSYDEYISPKGHHIAVLDGLSIESIDLKYDRENKEISVSYLDNREDFDKPITFVANVSKQKDMLVLTSFDRIGCSEKEKSTILDRLTISGGDLKEQSFVYYKTGIRAYDLDTHSDKPDQASNCWGALVDTKDEFINYIDRGYAPRSEKESISVFSVDKDSKILYITGDADLRDVSSAFPPKGIRDLHIGEYSNNDIKVCWEDVWKSGYDAVIMRKDENGNDKNMWDAGVTIVVKDEKNVNFQSELSLEKYSQDKGFNIDFNQKSIRNSLENGLISKFEHLGKVLYEEGYTKDFSDKYVESLINSELVSLGQFLPEDEDDLNFYTKCVEKGYDECININGDKLYVADKEILISDLTDFGKSLAEEYKDGELLKDDDKLNQIVKDYLDEKGFQIDDDDNFAEISGKIKEGYSDSLKTSLPNDATIEYEGSTENPPSDLMKQNPQPISVEEDKNNVEHKDNKPWYANETNGIESKVYDRYCNDTSGEFADKRVECSNLYQEGKESTALHNLYDFLFDKSNEYRIENGMESIEKPAEINYLGSEIPENSIETKFLNSVDKELRGVGRDALYGKKLSPDTLEKTPEIFKASVSDKIDSIIEKHGFKEEISQGLKDKMFDKVESGYRDAYDKSIHIDNRYVSFDRCNAAKEVSSAIGSELAKLGVFDGNKDARLDNPILRDCIDVGFKEKGISDFGDKVYDSAINEIARVYTESKGNTDMDFSSKDSSLPDYLNNNEILPEVRDALLSGDRTDEKIADIIDKFEKTRESSPTGMNEARQEVYSSAVDYSNEIRAEKGEDVVEKSEHIVNNTETNFDKDMSNDSSVEESNDRDVINKLPPNLKLYANFVCDIANANSIGDVAKTLGHFYLGYFENKMNLHKAVLMGLDAANFNGINNRTEVFEKTWEEIHKKWSVSPKEVKDGVETYKEWVDTNKQEIVKDGTVTEKELNEIVKKIDVAVEDNNLNDVSADKYNEVLQDKEMDDILEKVDKVIENESDIPVEQDLSDETLSDEDLESKIEHIDNVVANIEDSDSENIVRTDDNQNDVTISESNDSDSSDIPEETQKAQSDDSIESKELDIEYKNEDDERDEDLSDLVDDLYSVLSDNPDSIIEHIAELNGPDGESAKDLGVAFSEALEKYAGEDKDPLEILGNNSDEFKEFLTEIKEVLGDNNAEAFYNGLEEGIKDISSDYRNDFEEALNNSFEELDVKGSFVVFDDRGQTPESFSTTDDAHSTESAINDETSKFVKETISEGLEVDPVEYDQKAVDNENIPKFEIEETKTEVEIAEPQKADLNVYDNKTFESSVDQSGVQDEMYNPSQFADNDAYQQTAFEIDNSQNESIVSKDDFSGTEDYSAVDAEDAEAIAEFFI